MITFSLYSIVIAIIDRVVQNIKAMDEHTLVDPAVRDQ